MGEGRGEGEQRSITFRLSLFFRIASPLPRILLRTAVDFDSKISVVPPSKIEIKIRLVIRNKRQPDEHVSCRRKIPAAVRIRVLLRISPAPIERLIRHADHVKIK